MSYFLAIDGGGTKTHAVLVDDQGQEVGQGWSGPTSLAATSIGAAGFNLKEAVRQALETLGPEIEIEHMVMGLAGMDTPSEATHSRQVFTEVLRDYRFKKFTLVNDIVIALESGTDNPNAIALISGTGSNCWGRNEHGLSAKTGGMDFLLTDQGSAYAIGRQVLRAAVKSFDGRIPKTALEQLVCQHFGISSISDLKDHVYNPLLTKTEIAELSQLCSQAHEQGDDLATQMFGKTAADLYQMVTTVMTKLELKDSPVDCVLVGGITKVEPVFEQLSQHLQDFNAQISIVRPEKNPVYGAIKMARKS